MKQVHAPSGAEKSLEEVANIPMASATVGDCAAYFKGRLQKQMQKEDLSFQDIYRKAEKVWNEQFENNSAGDTFAYVQYLIRANASLANVKLKDLWRMLPIKIPELDKLLKAIHEEFGIHFGQTVDEFFRNLYRVNKMKRSAPDDFAAKKEAIKNKAKKAAQQFVNFKLAEDFFSKI